MDVMQLELVGLQGGCYGYRRILSKRQPQVNALRLNIPWEWWGAVPQGEERWPPAWTGWGLVPYILQSSLDVEVPEPWEPAS